jgi:methylenetetrahydrofolate dehydrogenase (NADP+)/methenyltetrahydrofolate cyclohydrolase
MTNARISAVKILDGNFAAAAIKNELQARISRLKNRPGLATILVGEDPGSVSYVAGKHRDCAEIGIHSIRVELPASAGQDELLAEITRLNKEVSCTGMIVQLPLPAHINAPEILSAIDPKKDADGLHPINLGNLVLNQGSLFPCTPLAIIELARRNQISWSGRDVVVIGRGTTVGRPLGLLLSNRRQNATVTLTHTGTKDLLSHTKRADIIVAAAGQAHFLTASMVKEGALVFDVGITRTSEGLVGDVHPDVAIKASALAPMPGGVGPLTRAMLLSNIVAIAENV